MANFITVYWILFAVLFVIITICDLRYDMLRDGGTAGNRPYSWSRVQLAWWTLIIVSAFTTILICHTGHEIPTLDSSTLILLGISAGTTATSSMIDISDRRNPNILALIRDRRKETFFLDILSDAHGVSISRLQTVIFNFVFGVWFIAYVLEHFDNPCAGLHPAVDACATQPWNYIIPVISSTNLALLGLSSATYAVMKSGENSQGATTQTTQTTNQQVSTQTNTTTSNTQSNETGDAGQGTKSQIS